MHARKVRDGKVRDIIFIEGKRLAAEALNSGVNLVECFIIQGFSDIKLLDCLDTLAIDCVELPESLFRSISATEQPQGVILLAERPAKSFDLSNRDSVKVPLFIFLKEVNNPSNLGAILRSVDAAGGGGVFVSMRSADPFSPKALRASMGGAFRVPVRANADLKSVVIEAKSAGVECLAVDGSADRSYLDVDWKKPHLLVYGSEAHGLSAEDLDLLRGAICIPMEPAVESLNLAVAVGVVLFEARRQTSGL
jgi:TrmH family RNA methyltransferase